MEAEWSAPTRAACAPLAAGTSLHRRYTVRKVLAQDEGGVLYDAFDCRAHQPVVIEEFFPASVAVRAAGTTAVSPRDRESGELFFIGSEAFLRQYGALTQAIGSPNIVSVFESFFENGTAYAATEPLEGLTLGDYLDMRGGMLTDGELVYILRAVADALLVVHSLNTLHHGVNAQRIVLSTDGTVKLTRFCAGRATVEQRRAVDDAAVWTDIRALGETLYRAYTGRAPDGQRADADMPASLKTAFAGMLSDNPAERCGSVFDLRYMAYGADIIPVCPTVGAGEIGAYRRGVARRGSQQRVQSQKAALPDSAQKQAAQDAQRGNPTSLRAACILGIVIAALIGALVWALTHRP